MKRIIVALMLCLVSIMGFGQLNIQTVEEYANYKTVCEIRKYGFNSGEIRYFPEYGYTLFGSTDNQFEKSMASIYLGETKTNAIQSIKDLQALQENGEIGQTYVLGGHKNKVTKAYIVKLMGYRTLYMKTDGIAGSSSSASCVIWSIDKYIDKINSFQE